ncbi:MAG TPA: hypothetical protein VH599_16360 [Ktedonobacterales bacterium]
MRLSKPAILLVLLGALLLVGCSPGAGSAGVSPDARPTKLQIKVFEVTEPAPETLLVENAATVQNVYNKAVALPKAPNNQACPAIGGPHYELTFLEGEQVVVTAVADRGGCTSVTFGAEDVHQPDEAFWQLLNRVVAEATPPVRPDRAEVVSLSGPQEPPEVALIASADQARHLYDALRALPRLPENTNCPQFTGPRHVLLFFAGQKRLQAVLDKNGCVSGPSALYELHQANDAFWSLLNQTLAGAPTEKARPDTLNMKTEPASNDPSSTASAMTIEHQDIVQKIFAAIYALPHQPDGQACPAIVGTIYGLSFSQDGVELLTALADKGGCGTVTHDDYVRLADQAFWDLLHQAETA